MLTKIIKYWYNTCNKLQQVNLTARVRMIYALKKAKQSEVEIISLVLSFISVQAQDKPGYLVFWSKKSLCAPS